GSERTLSQTQTGRDRRASAGRGVAFAPGAHGFGGDLNDRDRSGRTQTVGACCRGRASPAGCSMRGRSEARATSWSAGHAGLAAARALSALSVLNGAAGTVARVIAAQGLTKDYGRKRAVDELSFRVEPGVVTGFLGPNGSGKSTTMRLILGLDAPTGGEV